MDPISIKITFDEIPQPLLNYLLCVFYLFSIFMCVLILNFASFIYNFVSEKIYKNDRDHDYLSVPGY